MSAPVPITRSTALRRPGLDCRLPGREGHHDDSVLATALACPWRERYVRRWDDIVARSNGYAAPAAV